MRTHLLIVSIVMVLLTACAGPAPIYTAKVRSDGLSSLYYGLDAKEAQKALNISVKTWHMDFVLNEDYYERYLVFNNDTDRQYSLLFKNNRLYSLSELIYYPYEINYKDIVGECTAFPVERIPYFDVIKCLSRNVEKHKESSLDLASADFTRRSEWLDERPNTAPDSMRGTYLGHAIAAGIMNPFLGLIMLSPLADGEHKETQADSGFGDMLILKLNMPITKQDIKRLETDEIMVVISSDDRRMTALFLNRKNDLKLFKIGIHNKRIVWRLFDPRNIKRNLN